MTTSMHLFSNHGSRPMKTGKTLWFLCNNITLVWLFYNLYLSQFSLNPEGTFTTSGSAASDFNSSPSAVSRLISGSAPFTWISGTSNRTQKRIKGFRGRVTDEMKLSQRIKDSAHIIRGGRHRPPFTPLPPLCSPLSQVFELTGLKGEHLKLIELFILPWTSLPAANCSFSFLLSRRSARFLARSSASAILRRNHALQTCTNNRKSYEPRTGNESESWWELIRADESCAPLPSHGSWWEF